MVKLVAEVLVVELKNQPAAPPTVWLVYAVTGAGAGAFDAAAAAVIRLSSAMMTARFAMAIELSRCCPAI